MHSFLARLNAVFFFSLLLLGTIGFIASFSNYVPFINPDDSQKNLIYGVSDVNFAGLYKLEGQLRPQQQRRNFEALQFNFSIDIDLRQEFHWNTKQIFLWITADWYSTSKHEMIHSASLWDNLIIHKSQSVMTVSQVIPEYPLFDTDLDLRNNRMNFTVRWDIHPWIGSMTRKADSHPIHIQIPKKYSQPVQHEYNRYGNQQNRHRSMRPDNARRAATPKKKKSKKRRGQGRPH